MATRRQVNYSRVFGERTRHSDVPSTTENPDTDRPRNRAARDEQVEQQVEQRDSDSRPLGTADFGRGIQQVARGSDVAELFSRVEALEPLDSVTLTSSATELVLQVPPGINPLGLRVTGWLRCNDSAHSTLRVGVNGIDSANAFIYARLQTTNGSVGTLDDGTQDSYWPLGSSLAGDNLQADEFSSLEMSLFNSPRPRAQWEFSMSTNTGPQFRHNLGHGRVITGRRPIETLTFFVDGTIRLMAGTRLDLHQL